MFKVGSSGNTYFQIILSILVFETLMITQIFKMGTEFIKILEETRNSITTISGLISGLIIAFLTTKVLQIRQEKLSKIQQLKEYTQKLHKSRSIIDKLVRSQIWPDGMKYFVDKDFRQLTFFDVKELIFINSNPKKLAIEFSKDDRYSDISWVYLMLKSFKDDSYPIDTTLYTEFEVNVLYPTKKVQEWVDYSCGNGLWYLFDHKYSLYKDQIKLNEMYIGDKTSIENDCISIDKERYRNMNFGPSLLSKLGDQLESDILPNLLRVQLYLDSDLPKIANYLFTISGLLIIFGVLLPLLDLLQ